MEKLQLPFTLYPSRIKTALLLFVSLVFVAGSLLMLLNGDWKGWLCLVFFGLCSLVFGANLHPRSSYLTVSNEGLTFASLFRPSTVRWDVISDFGVYVIRQRGLSVGKFVGMNFKEAEKSQKKARTISKTLVGYEGGLPDTYGLKADDLAALLTSYLNEYNRNLMKRCPNFGS